MNYFRNEFSSFICKFTVGFGKLLKNVKDYIFGSPSYLQELFMAR